MMKYDKLTSITIEKLHQDFEKTGYIAEDDIIVPVYLALRLEKPILITGAPGVGKTEIAKVLASVFKTDLIRLQCYEGLDENKALYEWNYQRQLIKIQLIKETASEEMVEQDLFSRDYLLERPLLRAIQAPKKTVLLIDEIDKTDEEFEAFLFEVLSDFQVSIPELGTIVANFIPMVVLTNNGERELSDGLKRRCVYLYIDFPSIEKELKIIKVKVPEVGDRLAEDIAVAVHYMRHQLDFKKKPSISETLDLSNALVLFGAKRLEPEHIKRTINLLLKDKEDIDMFNKELGPDGLIEKISRR
ncbi:AAA family ATPase [Syntrophaceticus schinkii]|jgi:MoxR-like ATPase|uniref:ATPase associated with various cellular activities AAA_5 n=1 Tax=Syntrophaceticus schinkii TaxID=499207 RepID=A0A0B7MKC1_9FIRM|nr:MoxR family ATPase [Syntrophaceticus schinkii]CEO88112.1 ATPase associated with various cellular activities AAA_5 [Syntrophaceticus schinkii]